MAESTEYHREKVQKKKKRLILNDDQIQILEQNYQVNPNWSNETIVMLSERLGVTRTKIYKWNWDRKKK